MAGDPGRYAEKGGEEGRAPESRRSTGKTSWRTSWPLRTLRAGQRQLARLQDPAGLHRGLPEYQPFEAALRLHSRVSADGENRCGRGAQSLDQGQAAALFQCRCRRQAASAPQHASDRLERDRLRRRTLSRVQEARGTGDRGVQTGHLRPSRPGCCKQTHRRGPAPRGDEHGWSAGAAGRGCPLRRLGLHADRGLGHEHSHAHPGCARIRDRVALRAGGRPGPAPGLLRCR